MDMTRVIGILSFDVYLPERTYSFHPGQPLKIHVAMFSRSFPEYSFKRRRM